MILILKVFLLSALNFKRLELQMPDWSQIRAHQIFFNLRRIWHLWLKSFRNESTLKNNFQNQNYVKRASPLNAHFTSNWCCGQDNWPKPMKFLHKKSELMCTLNLFSELFLHIQKQNGIVFLYLIWLETPCIDT